MLDYLEVWGLLLSHPGSLDVARKNVFCLKGDQHIRNPEWRGMVYPVVCSVRLPGEVVWPAQQERSQVTVAISSRSLCRLALRLVES